MVFWPCVFVEGCCFSLVSVSPYIVSFPLTTISARKKAVAQSDVKRFSPVNYSPYHRTSFRYHFFSPFLFVTLLPSNSGGRKEMPFDE